MKEEEVTARQNTNTLWAQLNLTISILHKNIVSNCGIFNLSKCQWPPPVPNPMLGYRWQNTGSSLSRTGETWRVRLDVGPLAVAI